MSSTIHFQEILPKLSIETLNAINEFGYSVATPVQASTIPLFLSYKDVLCEAVTGSGKTLAFGIPIFELLKRSPTTYTKNDVGALVIAPTRELATQIYKVFLVLSSHHKSFQCNLSVGGTSVAEELQSIQDKGGNIIICTPGRILDIYNRSLHNNIINLKTLEVLVLDEADTLLDMGFKNAINEILRLLPKQRRTGLFSATQTKEVKELARAGMRNPVSITVRVQRSLQSLNMNSNNDRNTTSLTVKHQSTPTSLDNYYYISEYDDRMKFLYSFILNNLNKKIIIFCATCACVDYFGLVFRELHHELVQSIGKLSPTERVQLFNNHSTLRRIQSKITSSENITQTTEKSNKQGPSNKKGSKASNDSDMSTDKYLLQNVTTFHGKMVPKKRKALYKKFEEWSHGVMFTTDIAARGIDIPNIDWIIQLAAPKDPSFFVHRVGRTARAGRSGQALIFLTEDESAYIELLRGRGVPLSEYNLELPCLSTTETGTGIDIDISIEKATDIAVSADSQLPSESVKVMPAESSPLQTISRILSPINILESFKYYATLDRDILEAGSTAFISFLRSYKESMSSFIFRLNQLDIGSVARLYGLLRLPKIPETRGGIKGGKPINFIKTDINTGSIPYKHKEKEVARQKRITSKLEEYEQLVAADTDENGSIKSFKSYKSIFSIKSGKSGKSGKSFKSNNTTLTEKKPWIAPENYQPPEEEKRKRKKKQSHNQKFQEEWDDFASEVTTFKKFKKGKISKQEYDKSLTSFKDQENDDIDMDDMDDVDSSKQRQNDKKRVSFTVDEDFNSD